MRALLMGSFVSKQAISRFDGKILEGDLIYFLAFSNRFNFEVKKIEKFKNLRIQTPNFDSDFCIWVLVFECSGLNRQVWAAQSLTFELVWFDSSVLAGIDYFFCFLFAAFCSSKESFEGSSFYLIFIWFHSCSLFVSSLVSLFESVCLFASLYDSLFVPLSICLSFLLLRLMRSPNSISSLILFDRFWFLQFC